MKPMMLPIMPFIFLALLLLPIKLHKRAMLWLAFVLWLIGGLVLTSFGLTRLLEAHALSSGQGVLIAMGVSSLIGIAKGRFILSKTSARNIQRLNEMIDAQKPLYVYSTRSWITIGLMVLISLSLTWFNAPLFWRGAVNLAVGLALIVSSLSYIQAARLAGQENPQASSGA